LIPGTGGESWDLCEASGDAGLAAVAGRGAAADGAGLSGIGGGKPEVEALQPGMRAAIPGQARSSLG